MSLLRYTPPFLLWATGGAIIVSYYGPLSILNPFRHLLAMVETVRYIVGVMFYPQAPYPLFPVATEQSLNALAGLFGLAGWFVLMLAIFVRYGAGEF